MNFLADITNALPETILVAFGLSALLLGAIGGDRISGLLRLLAAIALAARPTPESLKVVVVNTEDEINAVTAISGSGPGYVFFLMEALAQAAQNLGFSEAQANLLVNQTFLGAATLAKQSDDSFATLREKVTSKGGTTFAGLEQLRALGVSSAIQGAAQAAFDRAVELQKNAG